MLADNPGLTPDQLKARLLGTTDPGPVGNPFVDGHGALDAYAAASAGPMNLRQSAFGLLPALPGATVSLSPAGSPVDTWNRNLWSGVSWPQASGGGPGWPGSAWNGPAWNGLAWTSRAWNNGGWNGAAWNGASLGRLGLGRLRVGRVGLERRRLGQRRLERVGMELAAPAA